VERLVLSLKLGESGFFKCITNNENMNWIFNGGRLPLNVNRIKSGLRIFDASYFHAGLYTCTETTNSSYHRAHAEGKLRILGNIQILRHFHKSFIYIKKCMEVLKCLVSTIIIIHVQPGEVLVFSANLVVFVAAKCAVVYSM